MAAHTLRRRVSRYTHRTLRWGRDHAPPGVRTVLGTLLMVGGVFGFLPVLGFWMLPLGAAFIALDIPPARRRLDRWIARMEANEPKGTPLGEPESPTRR